METLISAREMPIFLREIPESGREIGISSGEIAKSLVDLRGQLKGLIAL